MLTIGQLAAYAGVTMRAVRHYHHVGLLPEPERDASGYRRYGATAVVSLIKIRTLANAGVPLSSIAELLAGRPGGVRRSGPADRRPAARRDRTAGDQPQADRAARGRGQPVRPAGGEPTISTGFGEIGASERIVEGERDGWILLAARWPDQIREWMPGKLAQLEDPRLVRLYRLLSEIFESDEGVDDPRLVEAGRHPGRPARAGIRRRRGQPGEGSTTTCRSTCWTRWRSSPTRGWCGCWSSCASVAGPGGLGWSGWRSRPMLASSGFHARRSGRAAPGLGGRAGAHGGGELVAPVAVVAEAAEAGGGGREEHDAVRARPREGRRDGGVQVGAVGHARQNASGPASRRSAASAAVRRRRRRR